MQSGTSDSFHIAVKDSGQFVLQFGASARRGAALIFVTLVIAATCGFVQQQCSRPRSHYESAGVNIERIARRFCWRGRPWRALRAFALPLLSVAPKPFPFGAVSGLSGSPLNPVLLNQVPANGFGALPSILDRSHAGLPASNLA
jgi:hypothetical protein